MPDGDDFLNQHLEHVGKYLDGSPGTYTHRPEPALEGSADLSFHKNHNDGYDGVCQEDADPDSQTFNEYGHIFRKERGEQVDLDKKDNLIIDLHIKVTYGTNINAVSKSISHKVAFAVEESIGIPVHQVNVFVDDMNC